MRKTFVSILFALFVALCFAGGGEITGTIVDNEFKSGVPNVDISAFVGEELVQKTISDVNGHYTLKPLDAGTYKIVFYHTSYQKVILEAVSVSTDQLVVRDVSTGYGRDLPEIIIVPDPITLEFDKIPTIEEFTFEEIENSPTDLKGKATETAGVYQDGLGELRIRGSRAGSVLYYVDGIKMRSFPGLPNSSIYSMKVYTGALPAKYGDTTAGVIEITTKSIFNTYY